MNIKIRIFIFTSLLSFKNSGIAAVNSPSAGSEIKNEKKWSLSARTTLERGKVEPNENKNSFQKANINIYQLGLQRNIEDISFGYDHFVKIDYKFFTSGKEEVAGQTFYDSDSGHVATLSYGFNFVSSPTSRFGIYLSASPLADFNTRKFSNPRVDYAAAGITSFQQLSNVFFTENLVHYGLGIPGQQNSYLALTTNIGIQLDPLVAWPINIRIGPYAELDLEERNDEKYDAAFSAPGNSDRVRAMKVGVSQSIEFKISNSKILQIGYIQKIGGYDAPATQAYYGNLNYSF